MAAKVNTKFVIILSVVLIACAGGAIFVAKSALQKSSSDHIKRGDEFAAQGDWAKAADYYGQAVNKDEKNVEYLKKWIGALEKQVPPTRQQYSETYSTQYFGGALRGLSLADTTSYESQRKYLEEWHRRISRTSGDLASWETAAQTATEAINRFMGDEQSKKLLTRYRGLARAQVVALKGQRTDEEISAARADLQTALEGNAKDEEAFMTMMGLDGLLIQRARDAQQGGKADEMQRTMRKAMEEYAAANPPASTVKLRLYLMKFGELSRTAPTGSTVRDIVTQLVEPLTTTVTAFEQVPADKVDGRQLITLAMSGTEAIESLSARVRTMIDAAAKAQQADTKFQNMYAEFLLNTGETEKAVAVWDSVVKRETPPLSFAGLELMEDQPRALAGEAEAMFASWQKSTELKDREQYAQRAKGYRDALAKLTSEELPMLGALDARLKFISGDVSGARTLISKYNEQTGQRDATSVLLEAEIMRAMGNTGAAETSYKRVLTLQPRNVRALLALGQMAQDSGDYTEAVQYLSSASALIPADKALAEAVERLKKINDPNNPVTKALVTAQRLYQGVNKDAAGAIAVLDKAARDLRDPPEVMVYWASILMNEGRKDEANAIVKRGLTRTPNDQALKNMTDRLAIADPIEARAKDINDAVIPPQQKATQLYALYLRAGQAEKARGYLAEAVRIAPDDSNVIETQFVDAISRRDSKEMDRIAKLAEEKNLDNLSGLMYRSRRDIAEAQRLKDAATEALKNNDQNSAGASKAQAEEVLRNSLQSLTQLTTADKSNPAGWRLLGAVQLEMAAMRKDQGRNDDATQFLNDAAQSFTKALEIRPDDISSIVGYLRALGQTNQMDKALKFARDKELSAGNSEEFRQMWLSLESTAPQGDRKKAVTVRRDLLTKDPTNTDNRIALVYLLMDQRQWDEAKAQIEEIKAAGFALPAASLSADIHVRQGDYVAAAKVFVDLADATPKEQRTAAPYLTGARLMRTVGQTQRALDFYSLAREYQDPQQRDIDREVADTVYQAGDFNQALTLYKSILDGGYSDPGDLVRARVTEGLLNTGNVAEADAVLSKAGSRITSSATLSILAARIAMGQNDRPKARRLLDQAVAAEPKNPMTFIARSDFNVVDPQLARDVEQDLKEALRLSPTFAAARLRLANLYFQQGNFDAMIAQLREGVAADPGNDELRSLLCQSLLNLGRNDEAALVVEETVKARPDDIAWLLRGSQLMSQIGKKPRAVEFARQAFEKQKTVVVAGVYIKALMNIEPPDTQTAMKVLAAPEIDVAKDISARLLRARVLLKAKSADKALEDITAAAGLLDLNTPESIRAFFEVIRELYPDHKDRVALLTRLETLKPFDGWMKFFASTIRVEDPSSLERAMTDLQQLGEGSSDQALQFAAYGVRGVQLYREGKPEGAVAEYRKALAIAPNDPEMNNNLAYVLGVELGKPAEAEEFAMRAVAGTPNNALVLDTLGAIQMEQGKYPAAEQTLLRAISIARSDIERFPATVRFGLVKLKQNDKITAAKALDDVRRMRDANKSLANEHAKSVRELEEGVAR